MNEFSDYNLNKGLKRSAEFEFPRKMHSFNEQLKIKLHPEDADITVLMVHVGRGRSVSFWHLKGRKSLTHQVEF